MVNPGFVIHETLHQEDLTAYSVGSEDTVVVCFLACVVDLSTFIAPNEHTALNSQTLQS
jgi:hypothetical protein